MPQPLPDEPRRWDDRLEGIDRLRVVINAMTRLRVCEPDGTMALEFKGEPLTRLPSGVRPEPVLWASRGTFSYVRTEAVPNDVPGHWRTQFDLAVSGPEPVEMRCYLRSGDDVLSETWLYLFEPKLARMLWPT